MPPEKLRTMLVGAVRQLEFVEQLVGAPGALAAALPEVGAVKHQDLARREGEIQVGPLRHYADQPLGLHLLLPDVELAHKRAPAGGPGAGGQDADGGGFAGAVRAEQSEDLARADLEGDLVEGHYLELLLFLFLVGALGAYRGERKPGAARGHRRRRVVDLAELLNPYPNSHVNETPPK